MVLGAQRSESWRKTDAATALLKKNTSTFLFTPLHSTITHISATCVHGINHSWQTFAAVNADFVCAFPYRLQRSNKLRNTLVCGNSTSSETEDLLELIFSNVTWNKLLHLSSVHETFKSWACTLYFSWAIEMLARILF